ncbi:hypothetical protein OPV22_014958 [Ensete ventricosum]|uniref:Drought induced 19 protein type zinc-binding domain-containing protein n=1 Tax=Ensete ventricosum TaxID=4639 RepID=A0AAV8QYY8_ENSVE|nr:hypothetical protein OPV22_014958 [Ensete ventricosum]
METDSWDRLSSSSKRHESILRSRYDMYLGLEDTDGGEDESRAEFPCPFCFEDFDLVGLCCHLDDEHPMEVKNEIVCPICAARVAMDIVGHITVQHGNFHEMRLFKGSSRSHSTLSFLRKELQDANLRFSCGDSSYMLASSNAAPDPLLSSFIFNLPEVEPSKDVQAVISDEESTVDEVSDDKVVHSDEPTLSYQDEERARRREFVRELVLSTIFDGNL